MSLVASLGLDSARVIAICGAGGKSTLMFALAEEFAAAGERVLISTTTKMALEQVSGRWPARLVDDAEAICAMYTVTPSPIIAYRDVDSARGKVLGHQPSTIDRVAAIGAFARILVETDGSAGRPLKAPASHEPVFPDVTDVIVMVAGAKGLQMPLDDTVVFRARLWGERTGIAPGNPVTPESLATMAVDPEGFARNAPEGARRVLFINQCDDPLRLASARRTLERLDSLAAGTLESAVIGQLMPSPRIFRSVSFRANEPLITEGIDE